MYSVIAEQMTRWLESHYGEVKDPEWQRFLDSYERLALDKLKELRKEHENLIGAEKVFGVSGVGDCTNKAVLRWQGVKGEPVEGKLKSVWFQGHMMEPFMGALLEAIGWKIQYQYPIERHPFSTKADGLILESPGYDVAGSLWSCKSAGYRGSYGKDLRGMAEICRDGIRIAQPGYWAQAQAEMWASDTEAVFFTVAAKDYFGGWPTIHTELVGRNEAFIADMIHTWRTVWSQRELRHPTPYVLGPDSHYWPLPIAGEQSKGWRDGQNWRVTGKYNVCHKCSFAVHCRGGV